MAAYFMAALPVIVVFLFTMRLFVRGLSQGAIKGEPTSLLNQSQVWRHLRYHLPRHPNTMQNGFKITQTRVFGVQPNR
jgi:hypothetical protein